MKFLYLTFAFALLIPKMLSAQIVTYTDGKIEIPNLNAYPDGPMGYGSLLWFSSSGTPMTSIQENWGLNIMGEAMRPIKVYNASLLVGAYFPGNVDYGIGNGYFTGKLGVATSNAISTFQVDDGCTKASIGDASGIGLNYGTSYLGFNAARNGTSWSTSNDGTSGASGNNGGGVIYSSVLGDMYFSILPTTGGSSGQALSDAQVKGNIAMRIDHTNGAMYAKQIFVQTTGFPDYVFNKGYQLMPLMQLKSYIDQNHHLPEMPAAADVEKNGQNLGEINKLLTKKVEELTLYLIDKNQEIITLKQNDQSQQQQIDELKKQMAALMKAVK